MSRELFTGREASLWIDQEGGEEEKDEREEGEEGEESLSANKVMGINPLHSSTTLSYVPTSGLEAPLQEAVLTSQELAKLLSEPDIQAKITTILQAPDPLDALQKSLKEDPRGIGRVANVIFSIMDETLPGSQ